jgi:tetratricopeptide (TPR) repeat protein
MGIFIDVNEELSNKVVENIINTIKTEREREDRTIQKICKHCIQYLTSMEANYELAEKNIDQLKKLPNHNNHFYLLLLGVLNESLDEDETAIQYFSEILNTRITENFTEDLSDFITVGKLNTLSDFSELENAGLILISKYCDESNVSDMLWQLSITVNPEAYLPAFEKLSIKAQELYPENFSIKYFYGYIKKLALNYEAALELFIFVKDELEKEIEDTEDNFQLANIWLDISNCYLKTENPDKAIEGCDISMQYDQKTEEKLLQYYILNKKAEALLLKGEKESALLIINQVLAANPENPEAIALMEKAKQD